MCHQLSRFACGHLEQKRVRCEKSKTPFRALNKLLFNDRGCNKALNALHKNPKRCASCKYRHREDQRGKIKQSGPVDERKPRRANTGNVQQPRPRHARSNTVQLQPEDYPTGRNSFEMMIKAQRDFRVQRDDEGWSRIVVQPPTTQRTNPTSKAVEAPTSGRPTRAKAPRQQTTTSTHRRGPSSGGSLLKGMLTQSSESSRFDGRSLRNRLDLRRVPSDDSLVSAQARVVERGYSSGHSKNYRY
ncbi:hypothetical protein HJFPF1_01540 [Paramyrothecium foliicola]|nr:hypothetical protein HJFPF1_01540 [Paramyrothecium foliicola]